MPHWEIILLALTIIGSIITITLNLRKFSDNIKQEAVWRTTVNKDMQGMVNKLDLALESYKLISQDVQKLLRDETATREIFNGRRKEIDIMWKQVDEQKDTLDKLQMRMMNCKACRTSQSE